MRAADAAATYGALNSATTILAELVLSAPCVDDETRMLTEDAVRILEEAMDGILPIVNDMLEKENE